MRSEQSKLDVSGPLPKTYGFPSLDWAASRTPLRSPFGATESSEPSGSSLGFFSLEDEALTIANRLTNSGSSAKAMFRGFMSKAGRAAATPRPAPTGFG